MGERKVSRGGLLVPTAILAGALLLAACGSVPASSSGRAGSSPSASRTRPATTALCADPGAVSRLVVTRVPAIRSVGARHFVFPRQVTVTDAATARAVARALCALPTMPPGVVSCPAQLLGTTYRLRFSADGRKLPAITVQATGCQTVTGLGPVRRVISGHFWTVLGSALALRSPAQSSFVGRSLPGQARREGHPNWQPMLRLTSAPDRTRTAGGWAEPHSDVTT